MPSGQAASAASRVAKAGPASSRTNSTWKPPANPSASRSRTDRPLGACKAASALGATGNRTDIPPS